MKKNVKEYKPNANPNQNKNVNLKSKGSNSMKKNRRITAILTAACLAMPLACTAAVPFGTIADENPTHTITLNVVTDTENTTYGAYQILKGTVANDQLIVTGWGNGFADGDVAKLLNFLQADTYQTSIQGKTVANPVKDDFDNITINNNSQASAIAFADDLSSIRTNTAKVQFVAEVLSRFTSNASGTSSDNKITGLADGYYIIKDLATSKKDDAASDYVTQSLGILQIAGDNLTVTPKIGLPTIDKQVKENSTGEWVDVADYEYGRAVPFRITATLPSNLDLYEHYYLEINDILNEKYKVPQNITVKIGQDYDTATPVTVVDSTGSGNCRKYINDNDLTITIEDVKALKENISSSDKIFLEYDSIIQNAYDCAEGQACLLYSKDPNLYTYQPNITDNVQDEPKALANGTTKDVGVTPYDFVKVYAYGLKIHKQDGVTGADLENAVFIIKNSDGKFAKEVYDLDTDVSSFAWVTNEADATVYTTNENGNTPAISGLDSGEYYIIETVAPANYNRLTSEIKIEITPKYTDSALELESVSYKINNGESNTNTGTIKQLITMNVDNNKGTTLPTTGGIGTKIFYIVGGMLVVGSGAALVIKKRVGKDEE